jgi:ribosomal protein S15P/S13E
LEQIRESLNKQANILESLQDKVVRQMEVQVRFLEKKTKALEEHLKFNHSPLNESINLILMEVTRAQDYLNTTASKEIKNVRGLRQDALAVITVDMSSWVTSPTFDSQLMWLTTQDDFIINFILFTWW